MYKGRISNKKEIKKLSPPPGRDAPEKKITSLNIFIYFIYLMFLYEKIDIYVKEYRMLDP